MYSTFSLSVSDGFPGMTSWGKEKQVNMGIDLRHYRISDWNGDQQDGV
jgi:hypothetical protein